MAEKAFSDYNDKTIPMWKRAGLQAPPTSSQLEDDEFFSNMEKPVLQSGAQQVGDEDFFRQMEGQPDAPATSQAATIGGGGITAPSPNQRISQASADIKAMPQQSPKLAAGLRQYTRDIGSTTDPMSGAPMNSQLLDLIKQHPVIAAAGLGPPMATVGAMGLGGLLTPPGRYALRLLKPFTYGYGIAKGAKMALGPELGGPLGELLQHLIP